ncbi:MAG: S-adenosylmethionine decarboxylase family protein [Pirellula sp.]
MTQLENNQKAGSMNSGMLGCEWIIDAYGCNPELLRNLGAMIHLCENIVEELDLNVVGSPTWHQFPGQAGVTGLYLLSESHLACHTYPEVGMATLNLYSCHWIQERPWALLLREFLQASHCEAVCVPRGRNACSPISLDKEIGR